LGLPTRAPIPASRAQIVEYGDTRVVIEATALRRGLLILGDQFYPGWRASVDGQPVPVLRVNRVLRGVILPPGEHRVVFRFAPTSLRIGGLLSLVGVIALVALGIWGDRGFGEGG